MDSSRRLRGLAKRTATPAALRISCGLSLPSPDNQETLGSETRRRVKRVRSLRWPRRIRRSPAPRRRPRSQPYPWSAGGRPVSPPCSFRRQRHPGRRPPAARSRRWGVLRYQFRLHRSLSLLVAQKSSNGLGCRYALSSAALAARDRRPGLAVVLAAPLRLPLVPVLLPLGNRQFALHPPVAKIEPGWDER